jgi:hypothetical protein
MKRALLLGLVVVFAALLAACKSECERTAERLCQSFDISDAAELERCLAEDAYACETSCVDPQTAQPH